MQAPRIEPLPEGVVNLADFEAPARARLDEQAWAYLNGGAADEITLRANRSAWDGIRLHPRVLRALAGGHTRVRLPAPLDARELQHPILLAPIAYQRLFHADGELATAHAAAAQSAGLVLSAQASVAMEDVAAPMLADAQAGPLWFQLYWRDDRDFMQALLQRVERARYQALVLTVDAPVHGARDRERRAGFQLPDDIRAVNLGGASSRWTCTPARARCSTA